MVQAFHTSLDAIQNICRYPEYIPVVSTASSVLRAPASIAIGVASLASAVFHQIAAMYHQVRGNRNLNAEHIRARNDSACALLRSAASVVRAAVAAIPIFGNLSLFAVDASVQHRRRLEHKVPRQIETQPVEREIEQPQIQQPQVERVQAERAQVEQPEEIAEEIPVMPQIEPHAREVSDHTSSRRSDLEEVQVESNSSQVEPVIQGSAQPVDSSIAEGELTAKTLLTKIDAKTATALCKLDNKFDLSNTITIDNLRDPKSAQAIMAALYIAGKKGPALLKKMELDSETKMLLLALLFLPSKNNNETLTPLDHSIRFLMKEIADFDKVRGTDGGKIALHILKEVFEDKRRGPKGTHAFLSNALNA